MRILHLHPGPDTGGQSMGGKVILEAAGHEVRVFTRTHHTFGYAKAELWSHQAFGPLSESWEWADLVVIHNEPRDFVRLAESCPKPLIVHHHGSRFRTNPERLYRQADRLGAVQVVSTLDLLLRVPSGGTAYWFPQNVDLPKMAMLRAESYEIGPRIRVAHLPTNRGIKGTFYVQQACRSIGDEVELVLPRSVVPWERCLRMKASADIYADQFLLGYGNNAIEAWAMGLPVIAGADERILDRMRREFPLPFYLAAKPRQLDANILALARSADCRTEWAARGMAHVQQFHAPGPWLSRFEELADLAIRGLVPIGT